MRTRMVWWMQQLMSLYKMPVPHRIYRFLQFWGARLVDAAGVDPYIVVSIIYAGSLAGIQYLLVSFPCFEILMIRSKHLLVFHFLWCFDPVMRQDRVAIWQCLDLFIRKLNELEGCGVQKTHLVLNLFHGCLWLHMAHRLTELELNVFGLEDHKLLSSLSNRRCLWAI